MSGFLQFLQRAETKPDDDKFSLSEFWSLEFFLSFKAILINVEYSLMPLLFSYLNWSELLKGQTLWVILREKYWGNEKQAHLVSTALKMAVLVFS